MHQSQRSKVRGGIQGSSRRRRRSSSSRHAVEHPMHKSRRITTSPPPEDPVDPATASITFPLSLPRYLSRPVSRGFRMCTITAFAPELAGTQLGYIREGLQCLGPDMLRVLASVKAELPSGDLPKEYPMVVHNLSCDMPTHMLAVYSSKTSEDSKRRVTLYPIHNIVFAAHCANLPDLPPSNVVIPDRPGCLIFAPVVPLCLPAPDVFSHLSNFLYTKRIDQLLGALLPYPVPPPLYRDNPESNEVLELLERFSYWMSLRYDTETLLTHALAINGMWRNVCALGIDDEKMWCALDTAWEIISTVLSLSTSKTL